MILRFSSMGAAALLLVGLMVATAAEGRAQVQTLTVDDIIKKLQNKAAGAPSPVTTGVPGDLPVPDAPPGDKTGAMQPGPPPTAGAKRPEPAAPAPAPAATMPFSGRAESAAPSIDLEIFFEYDSATIAPSAVRTLVILGQALASPQLKGGTFLIAGHTDAKGSREYNRALSERRARAIRDFLIETFKLDGSRLIAIGRGMDDLKNKSEPYASENRRVQVVNLGR